MVNLPGRTNVAVRVYNYAGVDRQILTAGLQTAASIFVESRVPLDFIDCSLTPDGQPASALCHRLHGPAALSLRILPKTMLPPSGLPDGIFGFAMMADDDPFPIIANLYFHRIARVADGRSRRQGTLLGYMMAHEAAHLLLGTNSHSKSGIMSIPWTADTLRRADRGELEFSSGEIRRMMAGCARRQIGVVESVEEFPSRSQSIP